MNVLDKWCVEVPFPQKGDTWGSSLGKDAYEASKRAYKISVFIYFCFFLSCFPCVLTLDKYKIYCIAK